MARPHILEARPRRPRRPGHALAARVSQGARCDGAEVDQRCRHRIRHADADGVNGIARAPRLSRATLRRGLKTHPVSTLSQSIVTAMRRTSRAGGLFVSGGEPRHSFGLDHGHGRRGHARSPSISRPVRPHLVHATAPGSLSRFSAAGRSMRPSEVDGPAANRQSIGWAAVAPPPGVWLDARSTDAIAVSWFATATSSQRERCLARGLIVGDGRWRPPFPAVPPRCPSGDRRHGLDTAPCWREAVPAR